MLPGSQAGADSVTRQAWSLKDDCLIILSVRSAFDLALRSLRLPPGSEVLLTALTVPDMVGIVRSHGLIPVPVDIDDSEKHLSDFTEETH